MNGTNIKYTYHVHSLSSNTKTDEFSSTEEATTYFTCNPSSSTSSSGGGCYGRYVEGHSHNSSCYSNVTCGYFRQTYMDSTGEGHFRCDGCGQVAYGSASAWDDSPHMKQKLTCGKSSGSSYYSTNCGHSHGELLHVYIDFS